MISWAGCFDVDVIHARSVLIDAHPPVDDGVAVKVTPAPVHGGGTR